MVLNEADFMCFPQTPSQSVFSIINIKIVKLDLRQRLSENGWRGVAFTCYFRPKIPSKGAGSHTKT